MKSYFVEIKESFNKRGYDLIVPEFGNHIVMTPPFTVCAMWQTFESEAHLAEEIKKHGDNPDSFLDWFEEAVKEQKKPRESFYAKSYKELVY